MTEKLCTICSCQATAAFVNTTTEDKIIKGLTIHPNERICMSCATDRGCTLFMDCKEKCLDNEKK